MDEDARTIWCGNLSSKCTEDILHELFLQAGPLEKVNIPKNPDGTIKSFGFVTYKHKVSVQYALKLFEGTMLYNRVLTLKARQNSETKISPPSWKSNIPDPNSVLQHGQLMNNHMFNFQHNLFPMLIPPGAGLYPSQLDSHFGPNFHHRRVERNHPYNREDNYQRARNRDRDRDRDRDHPHDHYDHHQKNHRDYNDYKNHKDYKHHKEHKNQRSHHHHSRNKRKNR